MQKPRRPDALKNLQYKPYEFQLVGEIVILCGLIEQILKDFPILLVEAKKLSAHAFTAHLGFQSLRDLNLTLIQDYVTNEGWRKHIKETIECADKLFEHRNRIVHGPFTILKSGIPGTLKTTARRKIEFSAHEYDRAKLLEVLSTAVEVFGDLDLAYMMQLIELRRPAHEND